MSLKYIESTGKQNTFITIKTNQTNIHYINSVIYSVSIKTHMLIIHQTLS